MKVNHRLLRHRFFWKYASIGTFCWLVVFSFPIYRGFKDMYWTQVFKGLNHSEMVADRYE